LPGQSLHIRSGTAHPDGSPPTRACLPAVSDTADPTCFPPLPPLPHRRQQPPPAIPLPLGLPCSSRCPCEFLRDAPHLLCHQTSHPHCSTPLHPLLHAPDSIPSFGVSSTAEPRTVAARLVSSTAQRSAVSDTALVHPTTPVSHSDASYTLRRVSTEPYTAATGRSTPGTRRKVKLVPSSVGRPCG